MKIIKYETKTGEEYWIPHCMEAIEWLSHNHEYMERFDILDMADDFDNYGTRYLTFVWKNSGHKQIQEDDSTCEYYLLLSHELGDLSEAVIPKEELVYAVAALREIADDLEAGRYKSTRTTTSQGG
tara:strand:- start:714 stop:1091 length:378 start_codon:yes stop_codon:yes gene_type:complete